MIWDTEHLRCTSLKTRNSRQWIFLSPMMENRFATVRLLGKAGYSVAEADTGEMGLRLVRETHPDLVLLSLQENPER